MTEKFDYHKFLSILNSSSVLSGEADFCHQLISLLADMFHAESGGISIFLNKPSTSTSKKSLLPEWRNMGDYFFNVDNYNVFYYNEVFLAIDPYSPKKYELANLKAQLTIRSTYQLEQMMQMGKTSITGDFIEFLKKNGCYYTLFLFLKYTPRVLAVLSLNRSNKNKSFTQNEFHQLYDIALPIANILNLNAYSNHLIVKMSMLTSALEEEGLIFVNEYFQILSYNLQAQVICRKTGLYGTIKDMIRNLSKDLLLVDGNRKYIFSPDREKYLVRVIANRQCVEPFYLLAVSQETPAVLLPDMYLKLLSRQEIRIVNLIRKGFTNKRIAGDLFISENTVKTHLKNIYAKLGVDNRTSLALKSTARDDSEL